MEKVVRYDFFKYNLYLITVLKKVYWLFGFLKVVLLLYITAKQISEEERVKRAKAIRQLPGRKRGGKGWRRRIQMATGRCWNSAKSAIVEPAKRLLPCPKTPTRRGNTGGSATSGIGNTVKHPPPSNRRSGSILFCPVCVSVRVNLPSNFIEGRQICLSFKFVGHVIQSINYSVMKEVITWELL